MRITTEKFFDRHPVRVEGTCPHDKVRRTIHASNLAYAEWLAANLRGAKINGEPWPKKHKDAK